MKNDNLNANNSSGRPGIMLYFDIKPALKFLTLEQLGMLFVALLEYGEYDKEPEFDGLLGITWEFMRPKVDRDDFRYKERCLKAKHSAYTRWERNAGRTPLSYAEWKKLYLEGCKDEDSRTFAKTLQMQEGVSEAPGTV